MTEAEPPVNPATNGKEFTSTDIEKLYSRFHAVISSPQPTITPHQISPPDPMIPIENQFPERSSNELEKEIVQSLSIASDAEGENEAKIEHIKNESNEIDCHCQKIKVTPGTAICSDCDRVVNILAHLNKERLKQLDDLEIANTRIAEELDKVMRQAGEITKLRKQVEELEDQLDLKTDELNSLEKAMTTLNEKYVDEIDKVAELQHAKDVVEGELEDLTQKLFENANELVASEAKRRYEIQVQYNILEKQLKETQEHLAAECSQLKELREKMEQMVQQQPQTSESKRSSSSDPSFRASIDFAELFGLREKSPEAAANLPGPTGEDGIGIDAELISEFKEFITQSITVRIQKINSIPFMRHCLEEDVDPCMRFGSNPRVNSRRIVEAIIANTCFIEEAPPGADKEHALNPNSPIRATAAKPTFFDRIAGNSSFPRIGCQCCGRMGSLTFQYRITNLDDWSLIDRYCRDRLVAVCEFYLFIRNIKLGLYDNRTVEDLYAECLRLRLQMFYARLGALPSMLNTLGIKGTELASARKPSPEMVEIPPLAVNNEDLSSSLINEPEDNVSTSPPSI